MRWAVISGGRVGGAALGAGWHVRDLERAATERGHTVTHQRWTELAAWVAPAHSPATKSHDARREGLDAVILRTIPSGTLEQIIFRMDAVQLWASQGRIVLNPPRAVETCVDKHLSLARMAAAGLPVPETFTGQRVGDALEAFETLGGDAVVKPLFGSEGFGITRVTDRDVAARVFTAIERIGGVIHLQRYIDHGGEDHRVFTLGHRVLASMRRRNARDWRTNVARGAVGEAWDAGDTQNLHSPAMLALRAAHCVGAWMAGVDLARDRQGHWHVIEVNAIPGWRELSRATGVDVAREVVLGVESVVERGGV